MARFRQAPARPPAVAASCMVATSQPLATRAGLAMLDRGGNAADAALAAAAVLCVTEPMSTGVGGDAFAIVFRDGEVSGLDAAGPAAAASAPWPVALTGPGSITVPGAVAGWAALAERHGRLGLDACLGPAIDVAEQGFGVAPLCAAAWRASAVAPAELGPPPRVGEVVKLPALGRTLRAIAAAGPRALYGGEIAAAIASASALVEEDLAGYAPRWVEPLRIGYGGCEVLELPPPTQGVAALEGLGLLREDPGGGPPGLAALVACVRLALADARANVRDGADVGGLLDPAFLAERRTEPPPPAGEPPAGTVYLCAVDGDGMAVSFIQSLFGSFGSGVVAPGTGIVLQNRGAGFAVEGRVRPGRRPYHTIIPGLLLRKGRLLGPFGVMGGLIQAQAHVQLVSGLLDRGLDPQAALDAPRFRVEPDRLLLEEAEWPERAELDGLDLPVVVTDDPLAFGGGQAILVEGDVLVGGSDARKDGYAAGA